jgi:hypothetical protein
MTTVKLDESIMSILQAADSPEQCQEAVKLLKAQIDQSQRTDPPTAEQFVDFFKYGHLIKVPN